MKYITFTENIEFNKPFMQGCPLSILYMHSHLNPGKITLK